MQNKYKLIITGFVVAVIFIVVGVILLGFANETLDVIAELFGAPEWEVWLPPLPDYELPGFEGNLLTNFIIGIAFAALILVLTFFIGWLVTRRRAKG
ncbi:MAG: hypothetical protein ACFFCO_10330 [Promethearchaeota archaeon]